MTNQPNIRRIRVVITVEYDAQADSYGGADVLTGDRETGYLYESLLEGRITADEEWSYIE